MGAFERPGPDDVAPQVTARANRDPRISVCIPFYGKTAEILEQAVTSAIAAMPHGAELLILPHGDACTELRRIDLPSHARVEESLEELTFAGNLNRCLGVSTGDLIHILHDDDAVAPDFYDAILELWRRFPDAALYATGAGPFESDSQTDMRQWPREQVLLVGDDAAAFILDDERYTVPSVVLTRRVITALGPFDEEFTYAPDEEAYPRYASSGGIAFDPRPLYRTREHRGQSRFGTWHRDDFVAKYVESRVAGADNFSPKSVELARRSSARRLISAAVSLALAGEASTARDRLEELGAVVPGCRRWPRYQLARLVARSATMRRAAALRRTIRAR